MNSRNADASCVMQEMPEFQSILLSPARVSLLLTEEPDSGDCR